MQVTSITISGKIFLIFSILAILFLKKRYVPVIVILTATFMTYNQMIVFGGLHFTLIRLLIIVCWFRLFFRKELNITKLNYIDKTLFLWALISVITYFLLWGTYDAFKNRMGLFYDAVGLYFMFRITIENYEDIESIIKVMAVVIIPVALFMIYEKFKGINPYSYFAGAYPLSEIRNGRIRCQGPFRHSILAGTYGATSIPMFVALYASREKNKILASLGILSAIIIIFTSASSGPALAFMMSLVGLFFWYYRDKMKMVRWGLVIFVIMLHAIMKAPVWFIFDRISGVIGGSGWHRAYLIDQAINHFTDWWLIGSKYTADWLPYALAVNPDKADITNTYIGNAVNGGLITMIFFILIIIQCFRGIGTAQKIISSHPFGQRFCLWAIGVSLFTHVVSFFSISYFDQMMVFWYMIIAIISTIFTINAQITTKEFSITI